MFKQHAKTIALIALVILVASCGSTAIPTAAPATATPVPPTEAPPTATSIPPTDTPPPPEAQASPTAPLPETGAVGETWTRTYGGNKDAVSGDLLLAQDGGYFVVGTTNLQFEPVMQGDVYLIRADAAGEVLWEKTYGGEGYDAGQAIIETGDGNLLIAGVTTSFGAEGMDAYLLSVDQEGDELWSRIYGGPLDERAGAIGPTVDGGYMLAGIIVDPDDFIADPGAPGYGGLAGRSNLYLLKVDGEGNELWSRAYDSELNTLASGGAQTPDGGFLALATVTYYPDPDDDCLLVRFDGEGNELWSRTWEEGACNPQGLIETSDGNYLISASYEPLTGAEDLKEDFLFIKVDPDGNEIWRSVFGEPDMIDYGVVLAEAADGGFLAVGERTRDRITWETDIVLVKIDESGQPLWQQITPASHTMFSNFLAHPDGGYVIAGGAFADPVFNILLIRTGDQGTIDDDSPGAPPPLAPDPPTEPPTAGSPSTSEPSAGQPSVADIVDQLEGLPLDQFFEESYDQLLLRSPEYLTHLGIAEKFGLRNDQLDNLSDAYIRETQALESAILDLLRTYDRETLSPGQQVSYDVYEWYLGNQVRGHQFMYHDYRLHFFLRSYHSELESLFAEVHPLETVQDVEDYIVRLSQVNTQVEQLLEGLTLREERGVIPPKFIVELTKSQLLNTLQMRSPDPSTIKVTSLAVYARLQGALETMEGLTAEEKQAFLDAAQAQIEASFIPAYLRLIDYEDHLLTIATDDAGVWKLPDGDAYYAYMLRQETSTDLTPQEIHDLGLAEVARIQAEMRAIFDELGYPQDENLGALMDRAINEAGYYNASSQAGRDQVVAAYEGILAEVDAHLDAVFDIRPRAGVEVVGDMSFSGGGGYYSPGSADGSRPGAFHAGVAPGQVPKYRMPTIAYHEAIPGHHFQIAIAQEADLPTLRTDLFFNGYGEGWALYAEQLGWELGLYDDDPYGNLGRLHLELLRAVRLVVDTGIHAMGWTREEARAYMNEALGDPSGRLSGEVERYIVLPAQATGYKIGMIEILALRQRAMEQLGEQFDIKEFHNVVLGNGSVPLEILERLVDDYIAGKQEP